LSLYLVGCDGLINTSLCGADGLSSDDGAEAMHNGVGLIAMACKPCVCRTTHFVLSTPTGPEIHHWPVFMLWVAVLPRLFMGFCDVAAGAC